MRPAVLKRKLEPLLRILHREAGPPPVTRKRPPLEAGLVSILTGNSSEAAGERGLARLQHHYVDWNEVRVSSIIELEDALKEARVSDAFHKADQIKKFLDRVYAEGNRTTLESMASLEPEKARKFLTDFKSLTPRQRGAIWYLGAGRSGVLADAGLLRVLRRLGLVSATTGEPSLEEWLTAGWPGHEGYAVYDALERHADEVCHSEAPECARCALSGSCVEGGKRLAAAAKAKAKEKTAAKVKAKEKTAAAAAR